MAPGAAEILNRLDKKCVDEKHWCSRRDAVSALESLDADESGMAAGSLRSVLLSDCNRRVRVAGARALGQLCTPKVFGRTPGAFATEAVPALACLLADSDPAVRKLAKDPFNMLREDGIIGDVFANAAPALPELVKLLDDEDWRARQSAVKASVDLGPVCLPACPRMAELLVDGASQVRDAAKQSLDALVDKGCCAADLSVVVPPMVELLKAKLACKHWKVRCAAAWTCSGGILGSLMNVRKLADILAGDRDVPTRVVAAELLGKLGLACLPATPELANALRVIAGSSKDAVKHACMDALLALHAEMVNVIGRAISKHPELEQAVAHAQFTAKRLGKETLFERDQAVKSLIQPSKAHIASVTELLRVILDPSCPGAAMGEGSEHSAIEALGMFREAGMLGGVDAVGQGAALVKTLMEHVGDKNWRVRLACAEALASQAILLKCPVDRLQHHINGDDIVLRTSAKRLKRLLEQSGAFLEPGALADAATQHLRHVVSKDFNPGQVVDQDLKMARNLALGSLKRLVKVELIEDDPEFEAFIRAEQMRENAEQVAKSRQVSGMKPGMKAHPLIPRRRLVL